MKPSNFDFRSLFVLDMANNHGGSVEHGLRVIDACADAVANHSGLRPALKFQFRQLDTFIHPKQRSNQENRHIKRFLETELSSDDFAHMKQRVDEKGMLSICTPFDEASVDLIEEMDFNIIKIASCSAKDWPLLERVARSNKPVVASTGGLRIEEIDDLVSFFDHRAVDFALMHCVSIYPIPDEHFDLAQIRVMKERYRTKTIGWSTHEVPSDYYPVYLATGFGAEMFERHVGVPTQEKPLNKYSSDPDELDAWLGHWVRAVRLAGADVGRIPPETEAASITSLKRGMYAARRIEAEEEISPTDVFFAMPLLEGQLDSGQFRQGMKATRIIDAQEAIRPEFALIPERDEVHVLHQAAHEVKAMLNLARIPMNSEFSVEYSHHHGITKFREVGATLVDIVNREYCKKLLVVLPGQYHPKHYHKLKEETFQVLYGQMTLTLDGVPKNLKEGDVVTVLPGVWHDFWSDTGVIFEEISSTHYKNDSFYRDPTINAKEVGQRKTKVDHWGRFQLRERRIHPS